MSDPSAIENDVVRTISPKDEMFFGLDHYMSVGRSALECIGVSLHAAGKAFSDIRRILDLPSGHGRVLRHLRAAFPAAEIIACDLLRDGVDWCAAAFGAVPVYSSDDPSEIAVERNSLDLIWVGSLLTHLDAPRWFPFLMTLSSFLRPGGILVFTTHGRRAVLDKHNYSVPYYRQTSLVHDYLLHGFGYANYVGSSNYGVSFSKPEWVLAQLAGKVSHLRVVHYAEQAWNGHQDCYACVRVADGFGRISDSSLLTRMKHKVVDVLASSRGGRLVNRVARKICSVVTPTRP